MLDRFVATLVVSSVSVTVGVTYVWAHGGSPGWGEPWAQAPRSQSAPVEASTGTGPTGFGNSVPRPTPTAASPSRVEARGETEAPSGTSPGPPAAERSRLDASSLRSVGSGGPGGPGGPGGSVGSVGAVPSYPLPAADEPSSEVSSQTPAETLPAAPSGASDAEVEFTVASFNILASRHTRHGGRRGAFAPGVARVPGAVEVLRKHRVSVVGFQEFEQDQRAAFERIATGWDSFPSVDAPPRAGHDAVAWDTAQWQAVERKLIDIPFFHDGDRAMPYVLLRHVVTGRQVWFSSFHNPTNVRGPAQHLRDEATRRQVALFNQLEATGHPQVVTGDMNEKDRYFCRVTGETALVAAAGGSNDGSCRPPKQSRIDWIFASPGARFLDYQVDRSDLVRQVTDHPVLVSRIRFGA